MIEMQTDQDGYRKPSAAGHDGKRIPSSPDQHADRSACADAGLTAEDMVGCRWIEGPVLPLRRGLFCCEPTVPDSAWCARHRAIVYRIWIRPRAGEARMTLKPRLPKLESVSVIQR